jgi:hypothetical protein
MTMRVNGAPNAAQTETNSTAQTARSTPNSNRNVVDQLSSAISFNRFSGQLDNLEDMLISVLAENEQGAKADLLAIHGKIKSNNSRKDVLRQLKSLADEMDSLKSQKFDSDGKQIGDGEDISAIKERDLLDKTQKLIDENPWLQGTETQKLFNGVGTGGAGLWEHHSKSTFAERLSAFSSAIEADSQRYGDVGDELAFEIQLATNKMSRATQVKSSLSKRFHDTANSIIGNIRG